MSEVGKYQSVMDVAVQAYGRVEGAFRLVEDNGLHGILDALEEGSRLVVSGEAMDEPMRRYLSEYKVSTLEEEARGVGIGFWKSEEYEVAN